MYCSCGDSELANHQIQKDKKIIGKYKRCKACGRIYWILRPKKIISNQCLQSPNN